MTDTPAEVAEALPCPFCGEVPTIANIRADENQGTKWGGVVCSCGIVGPEVRTGYEPVAKWADAAIREWNDQHAARIIADLQSQLAAQRERDGRDAARYRWLRQGDNDEPCLRDGNGKPFDDSEHYFFLLRNEELDAAIDAALKDLSP